MSERLHSTDIGPEEYNLVNELFEAVELKFREAVVRNGFMSDGTYVVTDRDPDTYESLARFGLADSYEEVIRHGRGHFIEATIPVMSGLYGLPTANLEADNPSRYVKFSVRDEQGSYRNLKIQNEKLEETAHPRLTRRRWLLPPIIVPKTDIQPFLEHVREYVVIPLR